MAFNPSSGCCTALDALEQMHQRFWTLKKKTEAFPYKPQVFSSKARFTGEHETRSKFFGWDLNRHQQAFWERNYRRPIDSPKTNSWNLKMDVLTKDTTVPLQRCIYCNVEWFWTAAKKHGPKGEFMFSCHLATCTHLATQSPGHTRFFSLRPIKFSLRSSSFKALQSCLTDHEIFKQTTCEVVRIHLNLTAASGCILAENWGAESLAATAWRSWQGGHCQLRQRLFLASAKAFYHRSSSFF